MSNSPNKLESKNSEHRNFRILNSGIFAWLINLPPIAWFTRQVVKIAIGTPQNSFETNSKARLQHYAFEVGDNSNNSIFENLVLLLQSNIQNEDQILQQITEGMVYDLGFVGAMVGTFEDDYSIPVRAFYVDPEIISPNELKKIEQDISKLAGYEISITNQETARVYCNDPKHKDNLSVRAIQSGLPETSDNLYDLFRPIVPPAAEQVVKGVQEALGINQVIAIPFFFDSIVNGKAKKETIGNLFAASKSTEFSSREIAIFRSLGQQAAVGIRNAQLYRKAEERRKVAENFARMAFSATAGLHELRNHIGVFKNYLQVLQRLIGQHEIEEKNLILIKDVLDSNPNIIERLDATTNILDTLHKPWKMISDQPTSINRCLQRALEKSITSNNTYFIKVETKFSEDLPMIISSPDMLTEVFNVVLKNATDAIEERGRKSERNIKIHTWLRSSEWIEITIEDDGIGIYPEHLNRIFDLDSSTNIGETGFGLYWSKDFIEGIGGKIRVESQRGQGSLFQISIPIPKEADSAS